MYANVLQDPGNTSAVCMYRVSKYSSRIFSPYSELYVKQKMSWLEVKALNSL